jgi:tyrosyl-DNA phosphodiesterase-1
LTPVRFAPTQLTQWRAMAASLVADKEEAPPKEAVSENETLEAASAAYQASREAFRDEERRRRAEQLPNPLNSRASSLPTPPPFSTPSSASSTNDPALPLFNRMHVGTTKLSDRAQMEKERLARQAAREAKAGQPRGSGVATALSQSGQPSIPSAGPSMPRAQSIIHPLQSPGPFPSDAAGEYYLDGELRHSTLTIGEPATEPTFDPQRVIGKVSVGQLTWLTITQTSQISLIIMCSFVLDSAFLDSILPPPDQVPTIVIRPHPREHHPAWNGKVQAQPTGEVFCYPRMVGEYG